MSEDSATVIDFKQKRQENTEKKRRSFERLVFQNFLGAYSVLDQEGVIMPITLGDISYDGLSFELPWNIKDKKLYQANDELVLRFYFTKKSYVPVICKVRNGQEVIHKDGATFIRYGCEFDSSQESFKAVHAFIDFMYKFSELSRVDHDDVKSFFY